MYRSSLKILRSIPRSTIPLTRSASSSSSSSSGGSKGYVPLAIVSIIISKFQLQQTEPFSVNFLCFLKNRYYIRNS